MTDPRLIEVGRLNLRHAIHNNCTDPDCEIHHPEVGREEETVNDTNLAFYIAGYYAGIEYSMNQIDNLGDAAVDEMISQGIVPKSVLEEMNEEAKNG
jgi:hypothetical protein